jgi:hypothetical protein
MNFRKQVGWQTHTAGNGYWSTKAKTVRIEEVWLNYSNDEGDFGELCARFNTDDWDCNQDGLIYTDTQWMREFKAMMRTLGFSPSAIRAISYSEQGMQGADYVSMDVDADFMTELEDIYRWTINKKAVNA